MYPVGDILDKNDKFIDYHDTYAQDKWTRIAQST